MGDVRKDGMVMFVTGEGPVMSVVEILTGPVSGPGYGAGNIKCKWWDQKENKFKVYYFNASELKPYKPGPAAALGGRRDI